MSVQVMGNSFWVAAEQVIWKEGHAFFGNISSFVNYFGESEAVTAWEIVHCVLFVYVCLRESNKLKWDKSDKDFIKWGSFFDTVLFAITNVCYFCCSYL